MPSNQKQKEATWGGGHTELGLKDGESVGGLMVKRREKEQRAIYHTSSTREEKNPFYPELRTQVLSLSRSSILNTELQQGLDQIRVLCGLWSLSGSFLLLFSFVLGIKLGALCALGK